MANYSVLIIDDDIWMQRILSKTLQSYGFKSTYLASNGFDGIALAVEHTPNLIILDILMPELSGHTTLKVIKKIKITKDIPVLMVSALSDVENLGLAVKSGTEGFISKPFTRATVYDKLISIFGQDEVDRIQRGEDFVQQEIYAEPEEDLSEADLGQFLNRQSEEGSEDEEKKDKSSEPKPKVSQDQLLQHYADDEKRNIESIKKMLLKSKK